jgi:hypothetical protein
MGGTEGLLSSREIRAFLADTENQMSEMPAESPPQHSLASRTPRRVERRLGKQVVAELVANYVAGVPTTQLALTYCLGKGSVLRLLHEHGVAMRRQPMTGSEVDQATTLYRAGWSLAKIGSKFGVDGMTVRTALLKRSILMRSAHERP